MSDLGGFAVKHFITVIPLQPQASLHALHYENREGVKGLDNDLETQFPIIVPMSGSVEKDEEICVTAIVTDHEHARANFRTFENGLTTLSNEKGFSYTLETIDAEYSESSKKHMKLFEDLISSFRTGDRITVDVTYGNKPTPMVILMALNYAYQFCENTVVDMVVYGEKDFSKPRDDNSGFIFDVSSLFFMNSIMTRMASAKPNDPLNFLKTIIGM